MEKPGCLMSLGMNPDQVPEGEHCPLRPIEI